MAAARLLILGWSFGLLLAAGCSRSHGLTGSVEGATDAGEVPADRLDALPLCSDPDSCADILLVIDSAPGMAEEQTSLMEQFRQLIEVLLTGDRGFDGVPDFLPLRDLHLGFVTADMGSGGTAIDGCAPFASGDNGVMHTRGAAPCGRARRGFVEWNGGGDANRNDFLGEAACASQPGTDGCRFAQPLEAALKALAPSALDIAFPSGGSGHGTGANEGFLRRDSILVVIVATIHDDCSLSEESFLSNGDVHASLQCHQRADSLSQTLRFSRNLMALRERPEDLIVSVIAGVPPALGSHPEETNLDEILLDPAMRPIADDAGLTLNPTCNVPGRGMAYPPIRLVHFLRELQRNDVATVAESICQSSFSGTTDAIIGRIL